MPFNESVIIEWIRSLYYLLRTQRVIVAMGCSHNREARSATHSAVCQLIFAKNKNRWYYRRILCNCDRLHPRLAVSVADFANLPLYGAKYS